MSDDSTAAELIGVTKRYPGVVALDGVGFTLTAGRVTALAGENGAGKSTLIKVLSGAVAPDEGTVRVGQHEVLPDPGSVIEAGLSVIYQELTDVPDMSVLDNVLLGQQTSRFGVLRSSANRAAARSALDRVGLRDIALSRRAGSLSPSQRQLLEIARCLARKAKVLVFDEPTSSLPEGDVRVLLDIIRGLRDEGLAILYVTHHLEEIFEIADDIVVMRDGGVVASRPRSEWTESQLVRAMLAKDLGSAYPWREREPGPVLLRVTDLVAPGVNGATLEVRQGEIVGLVGLAGAGRTELMKAVAGATRGRSGSIAVAEDAVRLGNLASARRSGIVFAPEDRKGEGLILTASIRDNLSLGLSRAISRAGVIASRRLASLAARGVQEFGVKADSVRQAVGTLSGGNQQKVILARVSHGSPRVILLDDPTRGVDIGAKFGIYESVLGLAAAGAAIVITSSDTDEVLAMSDRAYVIRGGRIVREVTRADFDREQMLTAASVG